MHTLNDEIKMPISCWDLFNLITSTWFGKQYYFAEEHNLIYSRLSHKSLTPNDALDEFLEVIGY